jgi:hypothetical protein
MLRCAHHKLTCQIFRDFPVLRHAFSDPKLRSALGLGHIATVSDREPIYVHAIPQRSAMTPCRSSADFPSYTNRYSPITPFTPGLVTCGCLSFGKVRMLPGPEEFEYLERDLADKLVCSCCKEDL